MLVNALHPALENAVVALNRVRADIAVAVAADILVLAMVHAVMAGEIAVLVQIFVPTRLIGHHRGFMGDVGTNDRDERADRGGIHMPATGCATAFHKGQDNVLMGIAVALFRNVHQAANVGFIGLNRLALSP